MYRSLEIRRLFAGILFFASIADVKLTHAAESPPPNIILFLADDMGLGDTSAYQDLTGNSDAHQIATPNIERLAQQGMRFTDAHSGAAVCTPTRIGLMTGRYSFRSPLKQKVGYTGQDVNATYFVGQRTVADMLQRAGYRTYGIGKWHLGLYVDDAAGIIHEGPLQHGFNHYTGTPGNFGGHDSMVQDNQLMRFDSSYTNLVHKNDPAAQVWSPDDDPDTIKKIQQVNLNAVQAYLADHQLNHDSNPFFVYYATHANHVPWVTDTQLAGETINGHTKDGVAITVPTVDDGNGNPIAAPGSVYEDVKTDWINLGDHWAEYYQEDGDGNQTDNGPAARARMVDENDIIVGKLLDYLEATDDPRNPGHKLIENTLFIFTSDNGSDIDSQVHVGALPQASDAVTTNIRGKKGTQYEGGTRVPFIAAWPGNISTETTCSALFGLNDMYATLAEITGQMLAPTEAVDSESVLAAFTNGTGGTVRSTDLIYKNKERLHLRRGDLRLTTIDPDFVSTSTDRFDPLLDFANLNTTRLNDLYDDLGEQVDVRNNAAYTNDHNEMLATLQQFVDQGYSRPGAVESPNALNFLGGDLLDSNNWFSYTAADNNHFPTSGLPGSVYVDGTVSDEVVNAEITQWDGTIEFTSADTANARLVDSTWRLEGGSVIHTNGGFHLIDSELHLIDGSVELKFKFLRLYEGTAFIQSTGGTLNGNVLIFGKTSGNVAGSKTLEISGGTVKLTNATDPLRFNDDGDPENDYVNFATGTEGLLITKVGADYFKNLWDNGQLRIAGQSGTDLGKTFAQSGFMLLDNGDGTTTLSLGAPPDDELTGDSLVFHSSGISGGTNGWILSENGFVGCFLSVTGSQSVTFTVRASGTEQDGTYPSMDLHTGGVMTNFTTSATLVDHRLTAVLPDGMHAVRIELTNAAGTTNRTLTIDNLRIAAGAAALLNDATDTNCLAASDTYIENWRKGDVALALKNIAGAPLSGAQVQINLKRHAFNFGVATACLRLSQDAPPLGRLQWITGTGVEHVNYRDFVRDHFNMVGFRNAAKWAPTEPTRDAENLSLVDDLLGFAETNDMQVRIHTVGWPNETFHPSWARDLYTNAVNGDATAAGELRTELTERIDYLTATNGRAQRFHQIDAVNEDYHKSGYIDIFGTNDWAGIYQELHDDIAAAGGNAKTYVNEFNVFKWEHEAGGYLQSYANYYRRHIEMIESTAGAPVVDGVGIQGHVGTDFQVRNATPYTVRRNFQTLLHLSVLDKPISITEFDITNDDGSETNPGPIPDSEATNILHTAMRTFFGSPAVDTFMMWGFWGPAMDPTKTGSALVDTNWNLTAVGTTYTNLMNQWNTETNLTADADGQIRFNGFYGKYDLLITPQFGDPTNLVLEITPGSVSAPIAVEIDNPDSDGDGIDDAWELLHESSVTNIDSSTDGDMDHIPDGTEYVLDYDPNVSNAMFRIDIYFAPPSGIQVFFDSKSSRLYTTEYTTNLTNPAGWQALQPAQSGSNGVHTVPDPSGDPLRAYRVEVKVP